MPDLKAKLKFWKLKTNTNQDGDEKRKKYEEDWPRSAIEPQSSFHIKSELDYQRAFESRFPPPTSSAHPSSSTRITKNDHDSAVEFARKLKQEEKGLRKPTREEIGHRRNQSSGSEKGLRKLSEEQKRHRREKSEPTKNRPPTDFQAILDDKNNGGIGHHGNSAAAGSGRHYNAQPGYGGDSADPNGAMSWAVLQEGHGHHGGNGCYGGDAGGYSDGGGYGGDNYGGGYGGYGGDNSGGGYGGCDAGGGGGGDGGGGGY